MNEPAVNKYNLFADDDSYIEFRQSIMDAPTLSYDKCKLPFDNIKLLPRKFYDHIPALIQSLLPNKTYSNRHLFYLYKDGICRASGYFLPTTKYFVICAGSLVSLSVDSKYEETTSGKARVRIIREACELYPNFFRVKKDAKCISATAAASYVLGRTSRFSVWKDENGELLSQIYPEHFIRKRSSYNSELVYSSSNSEINEIKSHLFHLKIASVCKIHCYAICEYRPKTNLFILKKNSYISTNSNFYKERQMSYLSHDITCQSLKEATELVLGPCLFDEQTLWKDSNNKSFKDLFVC